LVEDGSFLCAAHASGAHLMDGEARRSDFLRDVDVSRAGSGKHFGGLHSDVFGHGTLVLAPVTVNLERGNAPGVGFLLVDFDVIVVIGKALTESAHAQTPLSGHFEGVLEIRANTDSVEATGPTFAAAAALVAVAAEEILLLRFHVAEARDVDAIGTIAEWHFVLVAGHFAAGAAAHVVVHEVVAEFAAGVGEAVGKFGSGGVEENASRFERGGANEKDASFEFESGLG